MKDGKWTIWALFLWTASGILLAFFDRVLVDALWIMAASVYLGFIAIGVHLFIIIGVYAAVRRNLLAGVISGSFLIAGTGLYFAEPFLTYYGNNTIVAFRFYRNRAMYDRIVSEVSQTPPSEIWGEQEGVRYQVAFGPPVRVTFPQPGGLLDNWEGVIYDPTGEVSKATGWANPGIEFTAPPDIVELFGGRIVRCVHIEADYYRCWFT